LGKGVQEEGYLAGQKPKGRPGPSSTTLPGEIVFFCNMSKPRRPEQTKQFLLTFFDPENTFQVRQVNGFVLTKNIDGATGKPYVCIYTKKSFRRTQQLILSEAPTDTGVAQGPEGYRRPTKATE